MCKELKEIGLSQAMIAHHLKINRQAVNQWFSGRRMPNAMTMVKLADAMSELTRKEIAPADVYRMVLAIKERKDKEAL